MLLTTLYSKLVSISLSETNLKYKILVAKI